jgi:hypothetical protein
VGLFMTANNTAIMSALPSDLKGFASGMLETARQMGHTLAVPIVSAVMGAVVLSEAPRVGSSAAYLLGYRYAVLLMAGLCFGGVLASVAGALARSGWETRAAAARAGERAPEGASAAR